MVELKEEEIKTDSEREEVDGEEKEERSREKGGRGGLEPYQKPKGHLKVNGIFLAPLPTCTHTPAPLGFSPLALDDALFCEELWRHNYIISRHKNGLFSLLIAASFKWENTILGHVSVSI